MQGLPVYSNHVITRMTTIWGDSRIFHYKRPYFSLDMDIEAEKGNQGITFGCRYC
ncbi:two-component system activity regulator YycH [Lysinibacillus sp. MHQ-1]|nr:two-component system activity regulator YycH [Lysinibacillus sp. MHQ-1]